MILSVVEAFQGVLSLPALSAAGWGMAASFMLCTLLVLTKRWHGKLTLDELHGVQKFHTAPTPRVGGIPIFLAALVAWTKAPDDVKTLLAPILFAGLLAFIFGVAEDLTKRVGVVARLLATMASGFLAWWITDYSLSRVDVWGVDWFLQYTVLSVIFTSFAVGGVANAINIIDGFNGLASTASTLAFLGYAMMAYQLGDQTLACVSFILAGCVWGFFWLNWPFGKIFLGDGGSYFIGFSLGWVAVMLIERNPAVSVFAVLLPCIHPVVEVLFSVYRRKIRKDHPGMPDRLHLHSLLKRRYISRWFVGFTVASRNSVTGLLVGAMSLIASIAANMVYLSPWLAIGSVFLFGLGYVAIYARMVRHHWCSPIEFLFVKPVPGLARG